MLNGNGKYHIITYGCQMNLHESEKLAGILSSRGFAPCNEPEAADIIVFNTCCIRENAEKRAEGNIGALKQLKKRNKNLIIAVGGCMTQQKGRAEALRDKFPFIDIIFGTHNLEEFGTLLDKKLFGTERLTEIWEKEGAVRENTPKTRTSYPNAWVNITYGCNNFCTYCIVPYVRGRERSRSPEDILNEVRGLIAEGYKEITLLGQNVNSYGKDIPGADFPSLIRRISDIGGKFRLKFMTSHPKDFSEELVRAICDSDKACPSVHLPVQAGSDRILALMNRKYTKEEYLDKLAVLREYMPHAAVTTDIMVGFPTETEDDFEETIDLVKKARFSGAFTFVYSKRKGTPAAEMQGQVPAAVSKKRIMRLIALQNSVNREYSKAYMGKTVEVLCEGYDAKRDKYLGRDIYGRMIYFTGTADLVGEFVQVKVTATGGISLMGELI